MDERGKKGKAEVVKWPAEMHPPAEFLEHTTEFYLKPIVKKVEKLTAEVLGDKELEAKVGEIHSDLSASIIRLEIARKAIEELREGVSKERDILRRAGYGV